MSRAWITFAVVPLVALVACAGPSSAPSSSPAVARDLDPGGAASQQLAFDFGSLWVAVGDKGTVARIDPITGKVAAELKVSDPSRVPPRAHVVHVAPSAVVSAFGAIWAVGADGVLARIDPATNAVATFDVAVVGGYMAASDTALWISSYDDGALVAFDPVSRTVASTVTGVGGVFGVAVGFGSVWAVSKSGHEVVRLDPKTGTVIVRIPAPRSPDYVAIGAGSVWVTRETPAAVLRIDPASNAVSATMSADASWGTGTGIAFYDGAIWAGCLVRIDPGTEKVAAAFSCGAGRSQGGLAFGAASAWVWDFGRVHQVPLALVR